MHSMDQAYVTGQYDFEQFRISQADLALFLTDVLIAAGEPDDDIITAKAIIYNFGGTQAEDVAVSFSLDYTFISDTFFIDQISGAKPVTAKAVWDVTGLSGTQYISIDADPFNSISEIDEYNNGLNFSLKFPMENFPPPPEYIQTVKGSNWVNFTWDESPGNTAGYNLYRRIKGESGFVLANPHLISFNTYRDTGLIKNSEYEYVLTAFVSGLPGLEGPYSEKMLISMKPVTLQIRVDDMDADKNTEISLPVVVEDLLGADVLAVDLTLDYDEEVILVTGVDFSGTVTEFWDTLNYELTGDGTVTIHLAGNTPISEPGTLVNIICEVIGDPGETTEMNIAQCLINYGDQAAETHFGVISINVGTGFDLEVTENLAIEIYPNPLRHASIIRYSIPESLTNRNIRVEIVSIQNYVANILVDGKAEKGVFQIDWDLSDRDGNPLPDGMYFCRMIIGDQILVNKIVIIR